MKKRIISLFMVVMMLMGSVLVMGTPVSAATVSSEGRMPFEDVVATAWYVEGITFCYANSIINGVNEYSFSPDSTLTRAQFVTMLAKIAKVDLTQYADVDSGFNDVQKGQWFHNAITWASQSEYVNGVAIGVFSPDAQITREQIAKLMYVYAEKNGMDVSKLDSLSAFKDTAAIGSWAFPCVQWCVANGLINGKTVDTIAPTESATRAQAARIIMIFMDKFIFGGCDHIFSSATCTESAVCSACGKVNGLPKGHSCPTLSCVAGSACTVCGEFIANDANLHNFAAATCTKPRTCVDCGLTRGYPTGHSFTKATCTQGQVCTVCGAAGSPALGHTTNDGICSRCNGEFFSSAYRRIAYYTKTKGTYLGGNNYAYYGDFTMDSGSDYGKSTFIYNSYADSFSIKYTYYWTDGDSMEMNIYFPSVTSSYSFDAAYYIGSSAYVGGSGTLNASALEYTLDDYWGDQSALEDFDYLLANGMLYQTIQALDFSLDQLCGADADNFGLYGIDY